MRRREFITALGGAAAIAAWPLAAHGQRAGLRRIGVLWHAASAEEEAVYLGALREGLADLGHIGGLNITLEKPIDFALLRSEIDTRLGQAA
jgi:putative tryptophan/tyrosine transport system substrate-binding protein